MNIVKRRYDMEKLTRRQEDALNFIKSYIVSHGYPPTVREIATSIGG